MKKQLRYFIKKRQAAEEAGFALSLGEGWGYTPSKYMQESYLKQAYRRGAEKALQLLFSNLNLGPSEIEAMDRYIRLGYCYGDAALLALITHNRWLPDKLEYMMQLHQKAKLRGEV